MGQGLSPESLQAAAEQLAAACRRLHAGGLLAGAEGNLSLRLADGSLLVTASGVDKARIGAGQVLRVHADGGYADGTEHHDATSWRALRASSELRMHVALYAARPDVQAVVHAHPPAATGFAAAGRGLPADVLPELPVVVGPVALVPYARPGTQALADAIAQCAPDHEVFLLANHGVTAVGHSLNDAVLRLESVEQAARILLVATLLGGAVPLPPGEAAALASLRPSRELPS
jgi:L-fuculose-phosphate aldolase